MAGKAWFDYLPKPEYDRTFGVAKFRDAIKPSWAQKAIEKFREAVDKAEEEARKKQTNLLAVKQREEAKVPAVRSLGIEARAIPTPRAPMTADIQKFREATAPTEAATRLREKVQPLGLERLAGKRWTPEELGWIEQYRRGEMDEETLNDLLRGTASEAPISFVPPPVYEAAGRIPKVGKYAEPLVAGLGEPWNLAGGLTPSLAKVGGIGLGVTAGQAIEEERMPTATEVGLAVATPLVLGAAGKAIPAAVRGVREVAAKPEIASFRRAIGATLSEEAGGAPLGPRVPEEPKWQLTNDVPTVAEINKRMAPLYRVTKMTAKQKRDYYTLLAQKDLNELRTIGTIDDQMDALLAEIDGMDQELASRIASHEYIPTKAPDFGSYEREAYDIARQGKGLEKGVGRPAITYTDINQLRLRLKLFAEFRDNMKIMPAEPGAPPLSARPVEEPLVTKPAPVVSEEPIVPEGVTRVPPEAAAPVTGAETLPRGAAQRVGQQLEISDPIELYEVLRTKRYESNLPGNEHWVWAERQLSELPQIKKLAQIDNELGNLRSQRAEFLDRHATGTTDYWANKADRLQPQIEKLTNERQVILDQARKGAAPEAVSPDIASFRAATETQAERMARWKAGYKPEAPAAAPQAPTGGVPPTEPPTAPPGQPPTGAAGQMPERGYTGAQEMIDTKEATLLRPGKATQIPVVRQALSVLNPSVTQERTVLVAYNSRLATNAVLDQAWHAQRLPIVAELEAAWKETPVKYIGPQPNPSVLQGKGALYDFLQNPELYTNVSPRLQQAVARENEYAYSVLVESRGKYGVDILPYSVKPGGAFMPNLAAKESLERGAETVSSNYTSASLGSKFGTAKTRLYESGRERMAHDPTFVPETDVGTLLDLHDAALARMAGNETFKLGAGGKTLIEVVDETHPGLRQARETVNRDMANLRTRVETAYRQIKTLGVTEERLQTAQGQLEKRSMPVLERIDELSEEWGPELSYLSGQARELNLRINVLRQAATEVGVRRQIAQFRLTDVLQADVRKLEPKLDSLRRAYEGANLDPYVMNRKTFRYYTRDQSAAIDKVLTTKLPIGQTLLDVMEEIRQTAFGGDFSPATINMLLAGTADPLVAASNAKGIIQELLTNKSLTKLAQTEPEWVRRYNIAFERVLGEVTTEFRTVGKGPERIPGVKSVWRTINDHSYGAAEYLRYKDWKAASEFLQRTNRGMTAAVADAEAANEWSAIMPSLNPAERGASVLQAKLERAPLISPSFIFSPIKVLKDVASGLVKLGASRELSPAARWTGLAGREQLAIIRMIQMHGTLATIGILSYMASGYSPKRSAETVLNPAGGRYMSISTGKEGYIPIGGPYRSFERAMAPRYQAGKGIGGWVPFAGVTKWLEGKEHPTVATIAAFKANKDFMGRTIVRGDFPQNLLSGLWYAAERHMPLTGGAVSEKIRTGEAKPSDIGTLAREAGTQLAGVNFYETSPYEKLTELVPGWEGMTKGQRDEIATQRPEVAKLWNKQLQQGLGRGEQWAETKQETQQAADEFGANVLAAYNKPGITGADIMDSVTDFLVKRANQSELRYAGVEFKNESEDQKSLDAYYEITMDDVTTAFERNEFFDKQDAFIAANPRVKELIRQNHQAIFADPQMKALMAEIDAARDVRSEYYSIPAKRGYTPEEEAELAPWATQAAAIGGAPGRALSTLGLDPDLASRVLRYMHSPDNPARARFWRQNPDKKALKDKFYKDIPISLPAEELVGVQ